MAASAAAMPSPVVLVRQPLFALALFALAPPIGLAGLASANAPVVPGISLESACHALNEGDYAAFRIFSDPRPSEAVSVSLDVSELNALGGPGDFLAVDPPSEVVPEQSLFRTAAGKRFHSLNLKTKYDGMGEFHGAVAVEVLPGPGNAFEA